MPTAPLMPDDLRGRPIQALRLGDTYLITLGTTSTFATQAFESGVVRIVSDLVCTINTNSAVAAVATNARLPSEQAEYLAVNPGGTMHAIATATGRLWITEVV